jgi:hypothetical protein
VISGYGGSVSGNASRCTTLFFLPVLAVHLVARVRRCRDCPPISGKMECGHI